MSEIRKPDFTMLLRKEGKKKSSKLEFFNAKQWGYEKQPREKINRYRIRFNGKWFSQYEDKSNDYYTKWEIRDIIFRQILN